MRVNRTISAVLAAGLAVATLWPRAAALTTPTKPGGSAATVLNVGMPNGPQTENHNPFLGSSSARSLGYRWMIYEPLVMMNPIKPADGRQAVAGHRVEVVEQLQQARSLTIRDGVKWSDGKAMTADDVAYTFQLIKDNKGAQRQRHPVRGRSPPAATRSTLTFDGSQFVNQTKVLHPVRRAQAPVVDARRPGHGHAQAARSAPARTR